MALLMARACVATGLAILVMALGAGSLKGEPAGQFRDPDSSAITQAASNTSNSNEDGIYRSTGQGSRIAAALLRAEPAPASQTLGGQDRHQPPASEAEGEEDLEMDFGSTPGSAGAPVGQTPGKTENDTPDLGMPSQIESSQDQAAEEQTQQGPVPQESVIPGGTDRASTGSSPAVTDSEKPNHAGRKDGTGTKDGPGAPSEKNELAAPHQGPTQKAHSRQVINPLAVGRPLAPGIAKLVTPEIVTQLRESGAERRFQQFRSYAASRLAATRADVTGSEINGLARLSWFQHLLVDPLAGPEEAEEFTRLLQAGFATQSAEGIRFALRQSRSKLDVSASPSGLKTGQGNEADPWQTLGSVLLEARQAYDRMVAPLSNSELAELARNSHYVFTANTSVGHTVNSRGSAMRLVRLMLKMDRSAQWDLAETLAEVADPELLQALAAKAPGNSEAPGAMNGVNGSIVRRITTPAGVILVGGKGQNEYRLEEMKEVAAIVDLGGNDIYLEGTVNPSRPILIIIDLDGNDRYQGKSPGIQGSSIVGGSILVDVKGDDIYWGQDEAQGSTLGGVGILVDLAGNDQYLGFRRVQGQAIGGVGLLLDYGGKDDYRAAMWAQGFGGPLGFGLIGDLKGDDHYYVGGRFYDSYPETPGYEGWGQGVGSGIRGVANGGIGVLLEGEGDDVYEFDYFAHGGGYWLAVGLARDFAGNDQRLGATREAYNRSPRTQQRFQRFGNGWGCHCGVGFLIDDLGDDSYDGTIMGTGFGWDLSVGYLLELSGNDQYLARMGGVQGQGAQASLGVLYDFEGDDIYHGTGQGYASSSITYHSYPTCGGNFSFVIDYGGTDQYGCKARNNAMSRRGMAGFIVDRPKKEELAAQATVEQAAASTSSNPGR